MRDDRYLEANLLQQQQAIQQQLARQTPTQRALQPHGLASWQPAALPASRATAAHPAPAPRARHPEACDGLLWRQGRPHQCRHLRV